MEQTRSYSALLDYMGKYLVYLLHKPSVNAAHGNPINLLTSFEVISLAQNNMEGIVNSTHLARLISTIRLNNIVTENNYCFSFLFVLFYFCN